MGFLVKNDLHGGESLFLGKSCLPLESVVLLGKWGEIGFYEGGSSTCPPKSLSQGSGPSKSQRNDLSLFYLWVLSTRTYLWAVSEVKGWNEWGGVK